MFARGVFAALLLGMLHGEVLAHGGKPMTLEVTLKKTVMVKSEFVKLSDIATIASVNEECAVELENASVAKAPRVGYMERISREELTRILRGFREMNGVRIAFHGADAVSIQSAAQTVDANAIADVAVREVQSQLNGRFAHLDVTVPALPRAVNIPYGSIDIRARPLDMTHFYARLPVWVDIRVNGEIYRSVVVPVNIRAEREVMVAARDIPVGAEVSEKDFSVRMEDVAGFADPVEITEVRKGTVRMRRAIANGKILTQQDIYPAGAVLKGDVIKLTYSSATISLETTAIADQDGQTGEMIRVKPERGMDTVMAKVLSSGMAQVWEK